MYQNNYDPRMDKGDNVMFGSTFELEQPLLLAVRSIYIGISRFCPLLSFSGPKEALCIVRSVVTEYLCNKMIALGTEVNHVRKCERPW